MLSRPEASRCCPRTTAQHRQPFLTSSSHWAALSCMVSVSLDAQRNPRSSEDAQVQARFLTRFPTRCPTMHSPQVLLDDFWHVTCSCIHIYIYVCMFIFIYFYIIHIFCHSLDDFWMRFQVRLWRLFGSLWPCRSKDASLRREDGQTHGEEVSDTGAATTLWTWSWVQQEEHGRTWRKFPCQSVLRSSHHVPQEEPLDAGAVARVLVSDFFCKLTCIIMHRKSF